MSKRIAVVAFQYGGPTSQGAVKPFLFNLFNDPAILRLPTPIRTPLAWLISSRRAKVAQGIYGLMGDRSPLTEQTREQAKALGRALEGLSGSELQVFMAMRYWHPMTDTVVAEVMDYKPDLVILVPLYPQWSTATSESSLKIWMAEAKKQGLRVPTRMLCCYPRNPGFIGANAAIIREKILAAKAHGPVRLLFSAHGLPERFIKGGDPYAWQCEQTAEALFEALDMPELDHSLCFQSRLGPVKWIGPNTEDVVHESAKAGKAIVIAPIAFVSEHSETLVELGIEYREIAEGAGASFYDVCETVNIRSGFIEGLADQVRRMVFDNEQGKLCRSDSNERICPAQFGRCAYNMWRQAPEGFNSENSNQAL